MEIDIFTLFPEWFQWLREQRHVANVLAAGSRIECVDFRAYTPLSGGQVDDTPFGGGAGMVLRVDVARQGPAGALRRRPSSRARRRVWWRWPPVGGCWTTRSSRAGGRACADPAVRALRGLRTSASSSTSPAT